jgi:hypothetical protein
MFRIMDILLVAGNPLSPVRSDTCSFGIDAVVGQIGSPECSVHPLQLTRVGRVRIALMMMVAAVPVCGQDDGQALLNRLAEAARKNRLAAEKFLFNEEITHSRRVGGVEKVLSRKTYEVSYLEGENYYRLTGLNGAPLPVDDELAEQERFNQAELYRRRTPIAERRKIAAKQERNRLKLDLEALAKTHRATVAGTKQVSGRKVTVVEVAPAGKPRRPRNGNQWGRILAGRIWLDDETGYPVRAEMRQVVEWNLQPAGSETRFEWVRMEDAWLISLIRNVEPGPGGTSLITGQTYSSYSRFQAESKVTYTDTPWAGPAMLQFIQIPPAGSRIR